MKKLAAKVLTVLFLSVGLFGCRNEIPPVISGVVVDGGLFMGEFAVKRDGHESRDWELQKIQIEQLKLWLQNHRDGWGPIVASPPPPDVTIVLTHSDGTGSRIDLFDTNENWKHTIVVHARSASKNGIRNLTTSEKEELLAILKKNS